MSRQLNDGILEYQKKLREETIVKIEDAIKLLKEMGRAVTVSNLTEITGLHRTTFYKQDIRHCWDKKPKKEIIIQNKKESEDILRLEKEKELYYQKYLKSLEEKEKLTEKNKKITEENEDLKKSNEILRGQILMLQNKISVYNK